MIKKIGRFIVPMTIIAGITWLAAEHQNNQSEPIQTVFIGEAELKVEIADTPEERGLGLGDRENLKKNYGLLFVFEESGIYPFWMRDMKFPLDIIWLNENGLVVDMVKGAAPESYPNSFVPESTALFVLETNAGWAQKNNIKIGSRAIFTWKK